MSQWQQSSILTRHAYALPFREASEAERLIHHRHRRREPGVDEPHVIFVPRHGLQTGVLELPCMEALRSRRVPPFYQINMRLRPSNSLIIYLDIPSQCFIFVGDTAQDFIFSNHISERQCSNPHRVMQTQNLSERRVKHERGDHHR